MLVADNRFDWRKGLSTSFSQDARDHFELAVAKNVRLGAEFGSVTKRAGSQRVHVTAIGSGEKILGLHSWRPSSQELVGICDTDLFYKGQSDTNFTTVAASFSTSQRPVFAQHVIAGVPTLFAVDGSKLRSFSTAHTLTDIAATPSATPKFIQVYKGRMFLSDGTKTVYWSKIADPTLWASPDGGQANVDTYDAEGVVGMAVTGGALLFFKENSISRFTGTSQDTINIDEGTDGISPEIGCAAPKTIVPFEDVVFFLSDRGAYVASEAGIQAVGVKIQNVFRALAPDQIANAVAAHHRLRNEIWVFLPPSGQTTNTTGYCLDYRQRAWTGPWSFSSQFNPCAMARHELDSGAETLVVGGYDGLVRDVDVESIGAKDDVLRDGTGGTNVTMEVELPTLMFGDPTAVKRLTPAQYVHADLKTSGALTVAVSSDLVSGSQSVTLASKGTGVKVYDWRPGTPGRRLTLNMQDATSEMSQINGLSLQAELARRVP